MSDVLDGLMEGLGVSEVEAAELLGLVADADQRWLVAVYGYAKDNAVLPPMKERLADGRWRSIFDAIVAEEGAQSGGCFS